MALTPKIIATSTPASAAVMIVLLLGTIWAIAEYAPGRAFVQSDQLILSTPSNPEPSDAPHVELAVPFSPEQSPDDARLCAWTADQVFVHFEPLSAGVNVVTHSAAIAGLVEAYLDLHCPAAIHEGDWHLTAQILGVGVIHDVVRPQAEVYDGSIRWDDRARSLVPVASSTFDVLAPQSLCEEALRHRRTSDEPRAMPALVARCVEAF